MSADCSISHVGACGRNCDIRFHNRLPEFDETFSIEEEAVVCKKYESNVLKFTSAVKLSDRTTLNIVNGLKLKFVNDAYNGNYRIYNENKTIKNTSEASKVRGIMPILTLDDKEVERKVAKIKSAFKKYFNSS